LLPGGIALEIIEINSPNELGRHIVSRWWLVAGTPAEIELVLPTLTAEYVCVYKQTPDTTLVYIPETAHSRTDVPGAGGE